ncbi:Crp/Fnr family transcriptional regulator [Duncaniella muris]|uniref:Crp/Fnr family transcriptional regulator n=1 Tax=Duncaniella muris TaxID=2094150 RepID=UPI0025B69C3E|nr:Crp/Fnr family transcriptional regulator [Duncaniella muris]
MEKFNAFERDIDFAFWKEICEGRGELRHYRRGEYFVHSGESLKQCGWILNGGFKHALTDSEGCLKTVGFVFRNAVLANYSVIMSGDSMPTSIIALEDSDVMIVPTKYIREYLERNPELNMRFVQSLFSQAYATILDGYYYSPLQRYRQLIERFPRILELVSLGEIASYLNISRRQLHRFRESQSNRID